MDQTQGMVRCREKVSLTGVEMNREVGDPEPEAAAGVKTAAKENVDTQWRSVTAVRVQERENTWEITCICISPMTNNQTLLRLPIESIGTGMSLQCTSLQVIQSSTI